MTDSPEQRPPPRMPEDIVEEGGTVIAREGDVTLEIDGMGREDNGPEPEPGGDDAGENDAGKEDFGDA